MRECKRCRKKLLKKDLNSCKKCGSVFCASHLYSYVDGNNISITKNSPNYCFICYKVTYGEGGLKQRPTVDAYGERWHLNGKRHRIGGPAINLPNGYQAWYVDDEMHRIDGPACIFPNGDQWYFLKGTRVTEDLFLKLTGDIKELPLHLGKGFDDFIAGRLKDDRRKGRINCKT